MHEQAVKRFVRLWLVLTVTLVAATVSLSVLWFQHIDVTHEYFVQLIVVPAGQALVLTGATSRTRLASLGPIARATATHELVIPVLVVDAGLLLSGWLFRSHPLWGVGGPMSLHVTWIGTKAVAASLFLILAGARVSGLDRRPVASRGRPTRARTWLMLLGGCIFAVGVNAFWPWIRTVPGLVLGDLPVVLQWLVVYGALFFACIMLTLATADAVRRRSEPAAFHLEAATAVAFAGALIVVVNVYQRPNLLEPWISIARTCASLTVSFLLMGAILASVPGSAGERPRAESPLEP